MLHRIVAIALAAALVGAPAFALDRPKIAVTDLSAKNVEPHVVETLSELLTHELTARGDAQVVSRADLVALLGFEAQRQMVGCDDDVSCAAEIAGALGVARLVTGALGKVGDTYLLTLRIIDVRHARVTARTSDTAEGAIDDLLAVMRRAVPLLLAQDELLAPKERRGLRPAAPYLLASGGALLAAGAVVGLLQRSDVSELSTRFERDGVYDERLASSAQSKAAFANGLFIAGAACAVLGLGVFAW